MDGVHITIYPFFLTIFSISIVWKAVTFLSSAAFRQLANNPPFKPHHLHTKQLISLKHMQNTYLTHFFWHFYFAGFRWNSTSLWRPFGYTFGNWRRSHKT